MGKMRLVVQYTERVDVMTEIVATSPGVGEMLRGYSIEVNPNQPKVLDAAVERLDPGTEVFLAWIPGTDPMSKLKPAAQLRLAGLVPVPHIGARHLASVAQLETLASRLVGEAGVDRILIVGGDRARPAGPYDSSLAVMRTGVFQKLGITRMAIGGFPEGNPNISDAALGEALRAKVNFARSAEIELSVVTQFCFKAEPIIEWLERVRAEGTDVPVRVGLAGPAGLVTLARYAVRCGIGNSLHVLTEHPSFAKLLTEKGPEPIIRGIAAATGPGMDRPPMGIAGLHFYVFGSFNKTIDWIDSLRASRPHPAHT
jgi:methylenetetrahydrofolate reductase (NADPH)